MAALTIAIAGEADRAELETMICECYQESFRGSYDGEQLNAALPLLCKIDSRLLNSGRFFKVWCEDNLSGCGGWSTWRPGSGEEEAGLAHIRHFATRLGFMGRGVASALLQRCIDEARSLGSTSMQCYSTIPAEGFYARHGFEKIEAMEIALPQGIKFGAVLMERKKL